MSLSKRRSGVRLFRPVESAAEMSHAPHMRRPTNLPVESTSFIGRRQELSEVKRLLTTTRLLTLTGSGGAGKTRLALRAAAEMARGFPDGVWLVSLGPLRDPRLVTQAIFNALGLQDRSINPSLSTLTEYLAGKRLLLVLDNCEHLLDTCADLASGLLRSCPGTYVLATSRQALGVAGELRFRVPALSLPPDGDEITVERLLHFDAIALFAARAAAVAGFRLDAGNSDSVRRICRHLDGIPLALELAAGRMEGLGLDQLNDLLGTELSVLAGANRGAEARQQTLEATIEWSFQLLDTYERRLWARLSVFAGSFDHEAAARVCSGPDLPPERFVELLAGLVEKSVLQRDASLRPVRYHLLETLRRYGLQRLRDLGEEVELKTRHRDWVLSLAAAAGAWDDRQAETFARIFLEQENLWAALEFCIREPGQAPSGIEICANLYLYWSARGPLADARRMCASLLELAEPESLARARCLWVGTALAAIQNDHLAVRESAGEMLRLARKLRDAEIEAWSLICLAVAAWQVLEMAKAIELAQSALSLARSFNNPRAAAAAFSTLCTVELSRGDPKRVVDLANEGLSLCSELGEIWVRGLLLYALSLALWQQGDQRAETVAKEGVICKAALDDRPGLGVLVENLSWMAADRGAAERAATLLGFAQHLRESIGIPLFAPRQAQHEEYTAAVRTRLGDRVYEAALGRGRSMSRDEAVAYTLERLAPKKAPPRARQVESSPLTRRELELARLIAQGLTNREVATKLFIAERTVETHVTNMLNKLGLNSRTQLTRWILELSDHEAPSAYED